LRAHYLITTHRGPQQIYRLVDRVRRCSPASTIVVSHDCKGPPLDPAELSGASLRSTPVPVSWGDFSYVRSVLAVLEELDLHPADWVTILTGEDYVVRSLVDYEQHLSTCGAHSLIEQTVWENPANVDVLLARYRARTFSVPAWADRGIVDRVVNRLPGLAFHIQPRGMPSKIDIRWRNPFGPHFPLTMGADQLALSGRAVEALFGTIAARPELVRHYARTRAPSESFYHTILLNDPAIVNLPEPLHYIVWPQSAHPRYLTLDDLPAMRDSGCWFARKFHEDDPVLDELDRSLDLRA
jgi:hypothetical protein